MAFTGGGHPIYGARYVILLPGMPAPGPLRYENPRFRLAEIDTSSP